MTSPPTGAEPMPLTPEQAEYAIGWFFEETMRLQEQADHYKALATDLAAKVAVLVEAIKEAGVYRGSRDANGTFLTMALNVIDHAVENLPASAAALIKEIEALKASQRTPGTVEKCPRDGTVTGPQRCGLPNVFGPRPFHLCRLGKNDEPCPIHPPVSPEDSR